MICFRADPGEVFTLRIMEENLLIQAGWLIDGTGAPVKEDICLEVRGGKIIGLYPSRPAGSARSCGREGRDRLDFSDCTLLPGLVDSHVHLFMSGSGDPAVRRNQLEAGYEEARPTMVAHAEESLRHGVMALRDGGDSGGWAVRFKKEYFEQEGHSGCLKTAGWAWHAPGRYGKLVGRSPAADEPLVRAVFNDCLARDQVKVINSGLNSLREFGKETSPQFSIEELTGVYQETRRLGLRLMVHANGRLPVKQSLEAGCDSIEHGFFMGPENMEIMAERGIYWVPTAVTMRAYSRMLEPDSIEAETAGRYLAHQLEQIRMARDYGLQIAAGSDAGSLGVNHGQALIEEIGLFLEAGMTIEEAVKCASLSGAALLGIERELGRLQPGRPASFILVKGAPGFLPDSLLSPERVYFRGNLIE